MDELRLFRVVVRGHFADLDEACRDRLLAEVDEHDLFDARFTPDGWWVYDRALVAFNFRFEARGRGPDAASQAQGEAEVMARLVLEERGVPHKHLRSSVVDMGEMWS